MVGNVTMPCVPDIFLYLRLCNSRSSSACCSSACLIVLTFVITSNIGRDVALLGARVEHLAADAAGVRGCDPVQADVVQAAVRGVGQGRVEAELATGTPEPIGQGLHHLARGLLLTRERGRCCPPLSPARGRVAIVSPGLPGPDAGPDLVAVVEAGGALGGARLTLEAGVICVALPGDRAGVHTILPGTESITWNREECSVLFPLGKKLSQEGYQDNIPVRYLLR